MYSAVLMLALTAGSESVDFGRNRCHGCSAAPVCSTTYVVSCASSCSRVGLFHRDRCHGCTTSHGCTTTVSHGCNTSCSSACHCSGGGLFGRFRNRCHGCTSSCSHSCHVVAPACCGGTVIIEKKAMPKGETIPGPGEKKKASTAAPATIVVSLPADARLIVDGNGTTSSTDRRVLVTPELQYGSTYVYTMQAEVVRNGQTVAQTQQVNVRGGETTAVQFSFPTQGVASK